MHKCPCAFCVLWTFLVKLGLLMDFRYRCLSGDEIHFYSELKHPFAFVFGRFSCFERKSPFFEDNLYLFAFFRVIFRTK